LKLPTDNSIDWDYFIPRHLVSSSTATHISQPSVDSHNHVPSSTQTVTRDIHGTRDPGLSYQQPRLNLSALDKPQNNREYSFDWTVTPAIDSGYGTQDQYEGESSMPSDHYPSTEPLQPHSKDTSTTVMFATGSSESSEVNYQEYLNLDEDTIGEIEGE
jgi:hypothetical protein